MRNKSQTAEDDPLDREIDFSNGRPNPYWLGMVDRRCVRVLDRDLADLFPDNEAVNRALRSVAKVVKRSAATAVAKGVPGKTKKVRS